jgi:hypothetical protein
VTGRGYSATNLRAELLPVLPASPEKNRQVVGGAMQVRDVVFQACLDIMLLLGAPSSGSLGSISSSRPSLHRLDLKCCPWKLGRLRLHSRIDAQISESASDDTAREPQVLRPPH